MINNKPYKIFIEELYSKPNGMYVLDVTGVPFKSPYSWIEKVAMSLPPGVIAGNHSHKHAEAFLAVTNGLDLYWQDKKKKTHKLAMFGKKRHFFIIMPSDIPHAVKNNAKSDGIMVKFANESPGKMNRCILVQ